MATLSKCAIDPSQWSIFECSAWLESVELGDVREALSENSISGSELMELSEEDLKAMGISKLGLRKKLLKGIAELRADSIAGSSASSAAADSSETHDSSCDETRTYPTAHILCSRLLSL